MKRLVVFALATVEAVALAGLMMVCRRLERDEDADEHGKDCTCPAHDEGPDDLEVALAEAVEAAHAPLSWELSKTRRFRP